MIAVARCAVEEHPQSRHRDTLSSFELHVRSRESNVSGRARSGFEPSSSKLHRAKCGNRKQVADDVGGFDASKRRRRKSRLDQIAHLLRDGGVGTTGIELLDRFDRGEALRGCVFHRIEILIGEQSE